MLTHILRFAYGTYAYIYKFGMPYETGAIGRLLKLMDVNNLAICGLAVDICILDTTFYTTGQHMDLSKLQIPVQGKTG